mmetsp:Transcript_6715/g.21174  ORF Transcript_6715/g.21174 Transcript_6715/m.21174 type:complete len:321 (-) Transcript_6715:30-992(-)
MLLTSPPGRSRAAVERRASERIDHSVGRSVRLLLAFSSALRRSTRLRSQLFVVVRIRSPPRTRIRALGTTRRAVHDVALFWRLRQPTKVWTAERSRCRFRRAGCAVLDPCARAAAARRPHRASHEEECRREVDAHHMAAYGAPPLVPGVRAVLLLDGDGNRIVAKYYAGYQKAADAQAAFEAKLFKKTKNASMPRGEADVILIEDAVAVFRLSADARFYVVGPASENELILNVVLDGLVDALHALLGAELGARTILENLETAMLAVDELVDGGRILEVDANAIANRVQMRGVEGSQPITDMTATQAISTITDQIFKSMNN